VTPEQEIEHLRTANMALQRRLEAARRDAMLFAASVCEDHIVGYSPAKGFVLSVRSSLKDKDGPYGSAYAAKLREIAK
jgi:hypothetical protein